MVMIDDWYSQEDSRYSGNQCPFLGTIIRSQEGDRYLSRIYMKIYDVYDERRIYRVTDPHSLFGFP